MAQLPWASEKLGYAAFRMFSMIAVAARAGSSLLTIGRPTTR
jgi:hypothetical protein